MHTNAVVFDQIVNDRRSCREYSETDVDPKAVLRSLERATLSPNSSNLQLWEFYRVREEEKRKKFVKICLNQPAARTAKELIVFVARKDKFRERQSFLIQKFKESKNGVIGKKEKGTLNYYEKILSGLYVDDAFGIKSLGRQLVVFFRGISKPTPREVRTVDMRVSVHRSVALAVQTFVLSMKAEGYDTCVMEGFDSKRARKFLQLPKGAEVSAVVSLGVGKPEGFYGKRVRVANEVVIKEV